MNTRRNCQLKFIHRMFNVTAISLSSHFHTDQEPIIVSIALHFLTSHIFFQVTIGVFGHEEKVIYEPLTPAAIQVILRDKIKIIRQRNESG